MNNKNTNNPCFINVDNVKLEKCCYATLARMESRLTAKKQLTFWLILQRILGLFFHKKPVTQTFDIMTADWKLLAQSLSGLEDILENRIIDDVYNEIRKHDAFPGNNYNHELTLFWKQLFQCFEQAANAQEHKEILDEVSQ